VTGQHFAVAAAIVSHYEMMMGGGHFHRITLENSSKPCTHSFLSAYPDWVLYLCRNSIKDSSVQKLGSVCRRVYRIFSHAYFHHRPMFDEFEVSFMNFILVQSYKTTELSASVYSLLE